MSKGLQAASARLGTPILAPNPRAQVVFPALVASPNANADRASVVSRDVSLRHPVSNPIVASARTAISGSPQSLSPSPHSPGSPDRNVYRLVYGHFSPSSLGPLADRHEIPSKVFRERVSKHTCRSPAQSRPVLLDDRLSKSPSVSPQQSRPAPQEDRVARTPSMSPPLQPRVVQLEPLTPTVAIEEPTAYRAHPYLEPDG